MAIEKHLKSGEKFLIDGKLDDALVQFEIALKENPQSFKANLEKSIVLQRKKQYEDALRFLKRAEHIAKERNGKELLTKVLFRYCTLFYNMGEFEDAYKSLNSAESRGHDSREVQLWKTQLNNKLKKLPDLDIDVNATWSDVLNLPEFVKDEDIKPKEPKLNKESVNNDNLFPKPTNIRKDWFQSNDQISVSFFIKNLPKDDSLKVQFKKSSIEIQFPTSPTSEFQYTIGPLFAAIDPKLSSYKVFSTKLELYLVKTSSNIKWQNLERSEDQPLACETSDEIGLSYPNSSKSKKDWSKISISDDEDDDVSGNNENAFFQQLYKGADDDTKRAMMKSFVESNGTALSTNWDEVSKKSFETTPPTGMEAKKW